jgi:hypothetical protein
VFPEEHTEEHSENVHWDEKENVHLDVMSIQTMLDARMTLNRQVDSSSPSEELSPGDCEIRTQLPSPRPMPNTMPWALDACVSH